MNYYIYVVLGNQLKSTNRHEHLLQNFQQASGSPNTKQAGKTELCVHVCLRSVAMWTA